MCSLPDGYGSIETQKNLGADEASVARNALRDAQCACAAASISAGRYGCMLRVWLVGGAGDYTDSAAAPIRGRSHRPFVGSQATFADGRGPTGGMQGERLLEFHVYRQSRFAPA